MPATDPDALLAGLDAEQRVVAESVGGPVCVLAGAGTGKTRAITHRIAYGVAAGAMPAGQVLAVTFTTRAASEMRSRLARLGAGGVQARTFHSAALRQLQYFWPRLAGGAFPRVTESKLRTVAGAAAACRVATDAALLRDLTAEIEWAKSTLVDAEGYPAAATRAGRVPPVAPADVARVYLAYEERKAEARLLDFEDLLLLTALGLEEHEDVADEVRARYRHFVVDEFQDVNPLQHRLLQAWLGGRSDVCVVGDANQTIYSFAGATAEYLTSFPRRFPGCTVVRLVRDYRSTPQVVDLANRLTAGQGAASVRLVAQRPEGPEPSFAEYPDEPAEAAAVAAACSRLIAAGTPAREIAVLYRMNAQSEAYESALSAAGIPYLLRGGERFFARPEVRQAVMLLRGAARSPTEAPLEEAVRHVVTAAGWTPQPPAGTGAVRERWESVRALVELVGEMPPGTDLAGFVAELAVRERAQHAPAVDGVTLSSLHAAKGLEWDAVFLVGLVDGVLPIQHATTPAEVAEERRLLYVGVTRARAHLQLSWALARSAGGRGRRVPSRFLDGVRPAPAARRATGGASTRRAAVAPADPAAAEVFERLKAWRLERARALGQPAFCVFSNVTLAAIAQARPASLADLGAISGVGPAKLEAFGAEVLELLDR